MTKADLTQLAVTGATGRIGRLLRAPWAGRGVAWHGRGDGPLAAALAGRSCLVCLSGVTRGDAKALRGNVSAALDALNTARDAGLGRVLLMSSSAVYGRAAGPLTEERDPAPATPYGAAKLEMEAAVRAWCHDNPGGPDVACLRLGNVAGADALLGELGPETPRLDIFADGRGPRRNYIGPATLARVLAALSAAEGPLPAILNIGTPGLVDMADLLRAAGRGWQEVSAPETALPEVALDTARLMAWVPLPPETSTPSVLVREWREAAG